MLSITISWRAAVSAVIAGLTQSLARPVARGLLPPEHAHAAILAALWRVWTPGVDLAGQLTMWLHILALNIENLQIKRDAATGAVKRALKPLIVLHRPWNVLMAEAHDANSARDFPLSEAEVSEIVRQEVWFALPPAPRRQPHGR